MVTLCKQKYDIEDETLYNLVTEAFPIVAFTRQLEDKSRKVMEIAECTICSNGQRNINTLYKYNVDDVIYNEDGKKEVKGSFIKINSISKRLQKRLLENGMPKNIINSILD
jgi:pilus assembly protein CpaF